LINVESDLGRRTLVAISGFLGRFTVKQLIDEEVKVCENYFVAI